MLSRGALTQKMLRALPPLSSPSCSSLERCVTCTAAARRLAPSNDDGLRDCPERGWLPRRAPTGSRVAQSTTAVRNTNTAQRTNAI